MKRASICAITYEDLIGSTSFVLQQLTKYLGLVDPLDERYNVMETTGVYGFGDSGPLIRRGEVVKNIEKKVDGRVLDVLDDVWPAYNQLVDHWACRGMILREA